MTTVEVDSCAHPNRTLLSPWELLRKYVCADCGAVITCACDQEIATFVTPHQATYGRDQFTRDEVMVTHLLVPGVCYNCRGEIPPSFPKAAFRGATSNIHRYYWYEIWKEAQLELLTWCRANELPLFRADGKPLLLQYHREYVEKYHEIQNSVVERWKIRHVENPRYDFTRRSDADILRSCEVVVEDIRACYLVSQDRHVQVLPLDATDPTKAVRVEEFVTDILQTRGREVMFCESRPFQALYGSLMWLWVQAPDDPRLRVCMIGGRDGVGADERGLIWMQLPHDFGSPAHASRRHQSLQDHLDMLPDNTAELLWAYEYWQDSSRSLRQYLWAYTDEDQQRGRTILGVLGARRVKQVLRYLAEDYWQRYLGWPDLMTWRSAADGTEDVEFVEVKSSSDKLSDDQRTWIEGNRNHLQLPFRIVKVHRTQRLSVA